MKRLVFCLTLMICFGCVAFAQPEDAKTKKLLDDATRNGNGLQSRITVNDNVHVQAVLIPQKDVNRIFGKEIAQNYAVIEVNVSNKSKDAALIMHGVFIDYREWPFSGSTSAEINAARSTDSYQSSAFPNQVATEEYRVVRGQLLDAQSDTVRNVFLRWLTLAGNLAGAFTFSLNEQGIVKGIAAATGVGIPGVATAWPDRTIEQLNRVSDLGFRSNKVIPREGSDVLICFFPIDRFLTPGFRKLFLKSPALFFAPGQLLVDKSVRKDVNAAVGSLLEGFDFGVEELRRDLPCFLNIKHPRPEDPSYGVCLDHFGLQMAAGSKSSERKFELKSKTDTKMFQHFMALEFINSVSLNRVTVTVDGVMAVDVSTVAARIDEIDLDQLGECGDVVGECFWTDLTAADGVRTGVIRGAYLKGGKIKIDEAEALKITDVKEIDKDSTDDELHFSFKLTERVPNQKNLTFTVTKPSSKAGGTGLVSNSWVSPVTYSPTAIALESAKLATDTKTVTVITKRKDSGGVTFVLHRDGGPEVPVPAANVKSETDNKDQFVLTIDGLNLAGGCWAVQAESDRGSSNHSNKFVISPKPTVETATRDTTRNIVILTGDDLIDTTECGGPALSFQLEKEGVDTITVTAWTAQPGSRQAAFALPKAAKEGTGWTVHVLVGGEDGPKAPAPLN
jgi:hypothetical protein